MKIRSANQSDIPGILPMIAKICALHQAWDAAKYDFLPHPERSYQKWLSNLISDPQDLCLVAEESNQLVGFLIATVEREVPIYTLKRYAFVHDLWVEPDFRHAGVARQIVEQAIAHFTQLEIPQIRLDTALENKSARNLFEKCGFRMSTIEMLIELHKG
ncbi:GNAT family N-acetyltransferase [Phormidesmis sp. 146-12]